MNSVALILAVPAVAASFLLLRKKRLSIRVLFGAIFTLVLTGVFLLLLILHGDS